MAIKVIVHIKLSCNNEMKTDKIQLILISLACFLPVCQVAIFAGTEELVEIITLGIYLKV